MAWTNLPPTEATTDITAWDEFLLQMWGSPLERWWAGGVCNWPNNNEKGTWIHKTGTITAITETTLSSGQTWCGGTDDISGISYSDGFNCSTFFDGNETSSFYLQLNNDNDWNKNIVVGPISWTNTGTITFPNIRDYVTAAVIPSTAYLVGKEFNVLRGDGAHLGWNQRLPEWINAREYAKGSVSTLEKDGLLVASPTKSLIRDPDLRVTVDSLVGKELLVYADDGFLKRVTITGNDQYGVIKFATQTWTPAIGSNYCVVTAGKRAMPGRAPFYPWWWYRGNQSISYASHFPDDSLGGMRKPVSKVHVQGVGGGFCAGTDELVWDYDYWTEYPVGLDDLACGRPVNKPYSQDIWKTLRGVQMAFEDLATPGNGKSGNFVEAKSYDGASSIPLLNCAEVFRLAGINSYSGTTGSVVGVAAGGTNNEITLTTSAAMPFYPIQVHYSIRTPDQTGNGDGSWKSGRGVMVDSTHLLHEDGTAVFTQSDPSYIPPIIGDDGLTIYLSPGWSRYVPRTFKRLYDNDGVFIPDLIFDGISSFSTQDPATVVDFGTTECLGVGTWVKRTKSSKYIERKHEEQSYQNAQGFAWENGDTFAVGDLARYVGDDAFDPSSASGTPTDGVSSYFTAWDNSTQANYYDHFFVGHQSTQNQNKADAMRYGKSEEGGSYYLKDTTKNFIDFGFFGGPMRTETGTATGGSTTSLTDTTKADPTPSSPTNPLNCFWHVERFGGANPYLGFTVEVDIPDGQGHTITHKRLITSSNPTAVSVSWSQPLPSSASGRVYRIVEPYALNRFKGRTIKITKKNGKVFTPVISGCDKDTIFFADVGETVGDGAVYEIVEPEVGSVWKWDGSNWVVPSGADVVRHGVLSPKNFHVGTTGQRENAESYQLRFGRFMHGDVVSRQLFEEIYKFANVLRHVKYPISWVAQLIDGTTDAGGGNHNQIGRSATTGYPSEAAMEASAIANANALWGTSIDELAGAPYASATGSKGDTSEGCHTFSLDRRYAYAVVNCCNRQANAIDFYNFADTIDSEPPAGCPNADVFDNQGDPVHYLQWTLWTSHGAAIKTTDRAKLGSLALPSGSFCPGTFPPVLSKVTGYSVTNGCAILKFESGFQYLTLGGYSMAGVGGVITYDEL